MQLVSNKKHEKKSYAMLPVAVAADAAYLMPLATTLRSIADNNEQSWPLQFFVLNDGIDCDARKQIESSLPDGAAVFQWIDIDLKPFQSFKTLPRISKMTFARLVLPFVLPIHIETIIYLDIDVLVLGSLTELSSVLLNDAPFAAVKDPLDLCIHDPSARNAGVPMVNKYFNAGMLLIQPFQWRKKYISERAIDYLTNYPQTPFADQDALNVAADGAWLELSNVWNFQGHRTTDIQKWQTLLKPHVIHFVTEQKPWKPQFPSAYAQLYDLYRGRTKFARKPSAIFADVVIGYICRMIKILRNSLSITRLCASFK
ncbi:glycosyltransferase family 8 protein [Azohydromonas lata]|uniref:glycosyltransferase family 8 protein n=1 Tax=Azohydromonas lata TaxID=45677 RepID=UPI0009FEA289|nr:glycosyltransferase family 8 protein [Azohydromonas lata]